MDTLPVTIKRTPVGYVLRVFYAILAVLALVAVIEFYLHEFGGVPANTIPLSLIYLLAVAAVFLVSIYLYSLSYIEVTEKGIHVQNWTTLFSDTNAQLAWSDITGVTSKQGGILAELFGYGTIVIKTADGIPDAQLTWVASADYYAAQLNTKQAQTPVLVRNV